MHVCIVSLVALRRKYKVSRVRNKKKIFYLKTRYRFVGVRAFFESTESGSSRAMREQCAQDATDLPEKIRRDRPQARWGRYIFFSFQTKRVWERGWKEMEKIVLQRWAGWADTSRWWKFRSSLSSSTCGPFGVAVQYARDENGQASSNYNYYCTVIVSGSLPITTQQFDTKRSTSKKKQSRMTYSVQLW